MSTSKSNSPVLTKTTTGGIYRRHAVSCDRKGRCECPYVVVTRHRGKQHKSFHRTMKEAREAKGDRTRTTPSPPQARTPFEDYARAWVANCQGRTVRGFDEDTRKSYAAALEAHAIPHFGRAPLRDIERDDVDKLIAKLQRKGLAPASIARYLAPVRALFSHAVERKHMAVNPALKLAINAKVKGNRPTSERVKLMTRAELGAILAEIPEQHRLIFEVMAGTGCRISEALGLEWGDLGENGATLQIERQYYRGTLKPNTKTEAGARTVELSPDLADKLWERGADATGSMFTTRTGQRPSDRNLRRILHAAAKRAGVVGVTHHTFRHTHGSMLLDQGWTIPEVSERLGHANPMITAEVYSHAMPERSRDLAFLDVARYGQVEV